MISSDLWATQYRKLNESAIDNAISCNRYEPYKFQQIIFSVYNKFKSLFYGVVFYATTCIYNMYQLAFQRAVSERLWREVQPGTVTGWALNDSLVHDSAADLSLIATSTLLTTTLSPIKLQPKLRGVTLSHLSCISYILWAATVTVLISIQPRHRKRSTFLQIHNFMLHRLSFVICNKFPRVGSDTYIMCGRRYWMDSVGNLTVFPAV